VDTATIQIENLSHRYGDRLALDGVTFESAPASLTAILGPNGSGKTTLFRILTTLLRPSAGTARVCGADVIECPGAVMQSIGVVFQQPALDGKLTVLENLIHQGWLYGLSGGALRTRCKELLQRFEVADRAGDRVDCLSGGLRRRVELAKALLHRPRVLILDEPSSGLDFGARLTLMSHLQELRDRDSVTSLFTTHLMDEADRCDRVAILDQGRLAAIDRPAVLKSTIGGDVLMVRTAGVPAALAGKVTQRFAAAAEVVNGLVRIERDQGHVFVPQLVEAFPGEIESVSVGKPTLGDVFVRVTGRGLDRLRDDPDPMS